MSLDKCPECGISLTQEMIEANLCWECGAILDKTLLEKDNVEETISQDTVQEELWGYEMKNACELCRTTKAKEMKFGVRLCEKCLIDFNKVLHNDEDAIEKCSNEANFPEATTKAQKEIISLAKRKAGVKNPVNSSVNSTDEKNVKKINSDKAVEQKKERGSTSITLSPTVKKNKLYYLTYEKVLSTEEKREWIDNYVSIKKLVSFVWSFLGLGIGFVLARLLDYGWDIEMFIFLLIGGGIGGVIGTNKVGTAMMEAIAAEQSIVNEEILKEILDKLYEE